jgi:hypothetical protein
MTRIALIFGAGASVAHAEYFRPAQRRLHPPLDYTFFEKIAALSEVDVPQALERYARQLPGGSPFDQPHLGRRMEEFFRDLFFDFLDRGDSVRAIASAYLQLVDVYTGVIRETTDWLLPDSYTGGPVGRLIASAAEEADELDLLTFNHDLLLENEIQKRARLAKRWCLERGYGNFSNGRSHLQASAELFPLHGPDCDHGHPIRIHKLHGSLNWIVRIRGREPTHSMLTGGVTSADVLVSRRRSVPGALSLKGAGRRSRWYTWPVIVPPVYMKQPLIRAFMPSVWDDARTALQTADRILFFGYSLPATDIEAEKLFERSIATNAIAPWIGLIDPSSETVKRFAAILPTTPLKRFPTADSFLEGSGPWS